MDYIISRPNSSFIPMTIGANGVKVYTALDYATIYNVSLSNDYRINDKINWNMKFIITKGIDSDKMNLPFMSPFSYSTNVSYFDKKITADLTLLGNGIQNDFSPFYGEDKTPDFAVLNANFGYKFKWNRSKLLTKIGVENILDTNYSTYLDWNNLPQKGRNFFVNINYML
jgi:iron complex outermembrane receptor protein